MHRRQPNFSSRLVRSERTSPLPYSLGLEETKDLAHSASATRSTPSLVIFDRDGTLIEDTGYPINPEGLTWKQGALEVLAWLNTERIAVAVATNQSGVARGYFTLGKVHAFHASMDATVLSVGGKIAAYAICPHLFGGAVTEYSVDCDCRKPKPGLINQLLALFQVKPHEVIMIGDRDLDVSAGRAAGVESFLYSGGDLLEFTMAAIYSRTR